MIHRFSFNFSKERWMGGWKIKMKRIGEMGLLIVEYIMLLA